jgi:putative DNA primase/helicase
LVPLHRVSDGNKSASGAGGGAIIEGNRNATLASMAGTMRNLGMGQDAIESALLAENGSRCKPPLPTGEVQRIAKSVSRYTPTKDAALNDASGMFDAVSDEVIDWPDPLPIPNLPPVPAFDLDLLPSSIRPWVADVADRLQVPADMPAVAAVVALASAIGRRVQIRPKRNDRWTVPPNIWGMVIAPPGWKKSPALSAMMAPLHKLERDASHDHDAAMAAWLIDKERNAVVNSAAKSVGLKKLKNDPTAEVTGLTPDPDEPVPLRYVVNNFSLEALGEVMIGNPNGVLAFGDELYGLLKMADKPGNEELHSFLLTAWNGNDGFNFDRIGRGRRYVEYVCVSILGGIQPGRLQEYLTDGGTGGAIGSGFLNRFQMMTWPDLPTTYTYTDRVPNTEAEESYQIVFDRVARVSKFPDITGDLAEGPDVRQFDDEAQSVFDAWAEANDRLCRSDTLPPVLTSHLSKFGSLVASLALIFAVADEVKGVIPARYVHQAIGWSGYLRAQAERVFACTTRPDTVHARALLAKIKECVISDGFTARDVYRNEWSLLHRDGVEKATALLCDLDHLLRVDQLSAGRGRPPGAIYRINPKSKV